MRTFPRELAEFRKVVNERAEVMRTLSRDELLAAGSSPVEQVTVLGRIATVGTIVESRPDGSLRFVLQGFMPARWLPFVSSMALDGFYKKADGTVEPMPDDEFYEFG